MSYASTMIFDITLPSWNQMNMSVKNCLSCNFTTIPTNIKAFHIFVLFKDFLSLQM